MKFTNVFHILGSLFLIAAIISLILDYDTISLILAGIAVISLVIARTQAGKIGKTKV